MGGLYRVDITEEESFAPFTLSFHLFFQLQSTASVHERPLRVTWTMLLWHTLLAAAVREPKLLFVTERGFRAIFGNPFVNFKQSGLTYR